jgi:indolepyruvate ferredoxin oxidoreductase, alpha subunit
MPSAQIHGWDVLSRALRAAHFDLIVQVAGKPVTPTQEALAASGHARWANHEAAATQMALGAAGCGKRTAVIVKQVGMNAALDVLACAAPHRSGGEMVVIVGDDPGGGYSQIEGDSRRLAVAAELPCFDVVGAGDIPDALSHALAVSAFMRVPAVLRVTTQLLLDDLAPPPDADAPTPAGGTPFDPRFWRTDFVGHRRLLLEGLRDLPEEDTTVVRSGSRDQRVIATGMPAATVRALSDLDLLAVRRVFPAPAQAIMGFIAQADSSIIVLEDSGPLLEDTVRALAGGRTVYGRRSGHVPWAGVVDAPATLAAVSAGQTLPPLAAVPFDDPGADLGPFGTLFTDAADLGLTPIAVDAGECWAGVFLDNDPAPFSLGLGSAIGVAAGVALAKGGAAIAITGDMGAFHAGLFGLVEAVRNQIPVIIFVEDDGVATTTGGQPTPSAPAASGQRQVSYAALARAVGVDSVEVVPRALMASAALRPKLQALATRNGPSVIIIDEQLTARD